MYVCITDPSTLSTPCHRKRKHRKSRRPSLFSLSPRRRSTTPQEYLANHENWQNFTPGNVFEALNRLASAFRVFHGRVPEIPCICGVLSVSDVMENEKSFNAFARYCEEISAREIVDFLSCMDNRTNDDNEDIYDLFLHNKTLNLSGALYDEILAKWDDDNFQVQNYLLMKVLGVIMSELVPGLVYEFRMTQKCYCQ